MLAPGGQVTVGTVQLAVTALKLAPGAAYAIYPEKREIGSAGAVSVAALVVAEPSTFVNTARYS